MNPYRFNMCLYPFLPSDNDKPPTMYALLNSIVNYDIEEKKKIKDLAKFGRGKIFDFDYPLSDVISREEFEINILNKFMMRRIGFDTLNAFKIYLSVKLNEIMPMYNKLFDATNDWNIFKDGEETSRVTTDERETTNESTITSFTHGISASTSDRRNSELPQNEISDVRNGSYITDYNYDTLNDDNTTDSSSDNNGKVNDSGTTRETITRTPADKIAIYKNFIESKNNIMTMIYKDLESLFYQLV
ncbi:MAG: hypothetical protein MJ224_01660 [archaeon]|nr:hypothetical protein [archaeon]